MVTGLEAVGGLALQAATGVTVETLAGRLRQAMGAASSKAKERRLKALGQALGRLDLSNRVSLLSLAPILPAGVSLRDLETALSSVEVQSAIHELIAGRCAEASPKRLAEISENFQFHLIECLPGLDRKRDAGLAEQVYTKFDEAICAIVVEIQETDQSAWRELRSAASSTLVTATYEAAAQHNASLQRFATAEQHAMLQNFVTDYVTQVKKAHGHIVPPDFERKRKIPIDDLYVPPRIAQSQSVPTDHQFGVQEFRKLLDRTVLLGDPGGGKSTASQYLMYTVANEEEARVVPFILTLRDFAKDAALEHSFVEYVERRCANYYQIDPPQGAIEHLLLTGRALVIFDGLDELIDTSRRRELTERVELFSSRFPLARMLITSRRVGYEQAQLDPLAFKSYILSGFNSDDVDRYVRRWFEFVEDTPDDLLDETVRAFVGESAKVPDLTSTPLMLSLMCIIYRGQGYLPKNRPDVYEKCATLLFEKWDSSRQIYVELRAAAHIDTAIKHLALWMLTDMGGSEAVTESSLIDEAALYLESAFDSEHERRHAAKEFVEFCSGRAWVLSDAGTTAEGERLFKFTHRTFMEYFAAHQLTRISNGPEDLAKKLLPRIASEEWDVVAQLAVQIENKGSANGADRVFQQLLADRRRRTAVNRANIVGFMWRCLSFVHVHPATVRRLVHLLVDLTLAIVQQQGPSFKTPRNFGALTSVVPELRGVTSSELEEKLVGMMHGDDETAALFARSVIVVFRSYFIEMSWNPISRDAWDFWVGWASRLREEHREVLFRGRPEDREIWDFSLHQKFVTMSEFLDVARLWSSKPLDPVFHMTAVSRFFGYGYVPWANRAFSLMLSPSPTDGDRPVGFWDEDRSSAEELGFWVESLHELADRVDAAGEPPWLTRQPMDLWLRSGERDYYRPQGDEKVTWALWLILSGRLEVLQTSGLQSPPEGDIANDFERSVANTRAGIVEFSPELFSGTAFAELSDGHARFRDDWCRGLISLTGGGGQVQ